MKSRSVALRSARGLRPSRVAGVRRQAGSHFGTLANWLPFQSSTQDIPRERRLIALRAEDLLENDPHAVSLVGGMSTNVVGAGVKVQSRLDAEALGISPEEARQVQAQAERAWGIWCKEADAGGRMHFDELQYLTMHTALGLGEAVHLCRMLKPKDHPERSFQFALRPVSPHRLSTPSDLLHDPTISDGVQLGPDGQALGCWLQEPDPFTGRLADSAAASQYVYNPVRAAHRPVVLHVFPTTKPEQVRGASILAPAMKMFRDLNDCLDYNLVGQIITAAFPVAVYTENPQAHLGPAALHSAEDKRYYSEVVPGKFFYLNTNERIQSLANANPPATFAPFIERILRAVGSAAGMPYEVVAKDFSKTNYSSARAALLEAWRVFTRYQQWLVRAFCQVCYEAVFEEAWLLDKIRLPKGAPFFYDARHDWTRSRWIPPRRGHVDPLKEMAANIEGLKAGVLTFADVIEADGGDWEEAFVQQGLERKIRVAQGLPTLEGQPAGAALVPDEPETPEEEKKQEEEAAA